MRRRSFFAAIGGAISAVLLGPTPEPLVIGPIVTLGKPVKIGESNGWTYYKVPLQITIPEETHV